MNRIAAASAALLASTALAQAGGIERNAFTTAILFEQGTYVELGYSLVNPDVTGVQVADAGPTFAGAQSGGVAPSYGFTTLSYANQFNDRLTFSLVIDEPVGADVAYADGTDYVFQGSEAELRSQQITAAARYAFTDRISAFAGLRAVRVQGDAYVTTPAFSYILDGAESDTGYGYMLGAAYEIPDIALRVALTYFSEVDLDFTSREFLAGPGVDRATLAGLAVPSNFGITLPESLLLEAQTGVAEGTLVFGSIRWVDWSEFTITPNFYPPGPPDPGDLAFYGGDTITYTFGGARVLNETWTVLASVLYEEGNGGFVGNLGPTDGRTALSVGARYTDGPYVVSGGLQYSWIGDAQTRFGGPDAVSSFTDNDALSATLRVGYRF